MCGIYDNTSHAHIEDKSIDIHMDIISAVTMNIYCKDTKKAREIRHIFHSGKAGVKDEWDILLYIGKNSKIIDAITKVPNKKDLLHNAQYMITKIHRD
jgi:hypothetical protein